MEKEEKEGLEEREAGEVEAEELDDEDNLNRGEGSEVSCLDSDSEETSQYSSTRDNFSESLIASPISLDPALYFASLSLLPSSKYLVAHLKKKI